MASKRSHGSDHSTMVPTCAKRWTASRARDGCANQGHSKSSASEEIKFQFVVRVLLLPVSSQLFPVASNHKDNVQRQRCERYDAYNSFPEQTRYSANKL